MLYAPQPIPIDESPDNDGIIAMRAALRDLKVSMRKPVEHPRRAEMLSMLGEARVMIERING
jgi:hypothetical protein